MSSANKFEAIMNNNKLETRVALVEQSISHISETLIRIEKKMDAGFEKLEKEVKLIDSRLWTNFYWILGTMFTLSTLMCGIMAKGFHWFGLPN
jgi:uncharacterized coiled-coil protein SlyX